MFEGIYEELIVIYKGSIPQKSEKEGRKGGDSGGYRKLGAMQPSCHFGPVFSKKSLTRGRGGECQKKNTMLWLLSSGRGEILITRKKSGEGGEEFNHQTGPLLARGVVLEGKEELGKERGLGPRRTRVAPTITPGSPSFKE